MKCIIVSSGAITDYSYMKKYLQDAALVVCADGGAHHLQRFGVTPHVIVGDFDSVSEECLGEYRRNGVEIIRFPVQKDMTDTEIAIETAIERGASSVTLLGAMGTRLDHTLSNIFHLKKLLDLGIRGCIANEQNEILLTDSSVTLDREKGIKVSLLPLSGVVRGVTTSGLMYPLHNATMELGSSWGVSNEFSGEKAGVSISEGLLLVIKSRD